MLRPLKTEVIVEIRESNGKVIPTGSPEFISVLSHWNHGERITLVFNNNRITVIANELIEAIKRASY